MAVVKNDIPTFADVDAAARRITGHAHKTPVMRSRIIDEMLGVEVILKCENLQRIGAFKFRGAFNALAQFSDVQKKAGVVAYSSGNHAQAIALAARILGISATIVMPHDAPTSKVEATRGYGAEIVTYDRQTESREVIGAAVAGERGLTLIPPFDHPDVIAGQGTVAKELFEEVGQLDALFVPLGGGGLLSGSILSTRALSPQCSVYGVEPEVGNDAQQSLRSGAIVRIDVPTTIADGAQTQSLSEMTFEIIRREITDILTASDVDLVDVMKLFASRMKMVVEPTGCLGLAGLRKVATALQGKRVGVIISGGNVDLTQLALYFANGEPTPFRG